MTQTLKHNFTRRVQTLFLVLVFGLLTGFAPVLHSHEFDLEDVHQDCAPCQWSQDNSSLETQNAGLSISVLYRQLTVILPKAVSQNAPLTVFNKSPPVNR